MLLGDEKCLRDAAGLGLHLVVQREAPLRSIAEAGLHLVDAVGAGHHDELADAGQHERRQRVVDQRLVVDRQKLLVRRQRERIEPAAGAAGEDHTLACRLGDQAHCGIINPSRSP